MSTLSHTLMLKERDKERYSKSYAESKDKWSPVLHDSFIGISGGHVSMVTRRRGEGAL